MQFENSPLWLRTLAPLTDDIDEPHREELRSAFLAFRKNVAPLANDISLSVPNYTDHSITHCDSLWDSSSLLTSSEFDINPAEAFVLGGAFLVHDLGMGISAYENGLAEIYELTNWKDLLNGLFQHEGEVLQAQAILDLAINPTWDGISSQKVKAALTLFLRQNHADRAGTIISSKWRTSAGEDLFLLENTRLRTAYGSVIGKIARSHWSDVSALPAELPHTLGPIPGFPASWTVNPVKLACVLRLADAVQIDARRADPLHTPHRNPQGDSRIHWEFQEKLLTPQLEEGRVIYTSSSPFGVEQAEAWWLAYDTVKMIDSELRRVDNLCGDLRLPRFDAQSAAGAESPSRFSAFVQADQWEPIDARPFIGDQNLMMKSLGGDALYGSGPDSRQVPVRELLANALDATRAHRLAYSGNEPKPIEVRLTQRDGEDVLIIRDYGIGMTSSDIATKLCNFGTSGWKDSSMQAAFPGLISSGFSPTGKFGIGFFSAFMIADSVRVVSRHVEAAKSETVVLEFANGLDSRPILNTAKRPDQLLDPGTRIELTLRIPVAQEDGLFEDIPRKTFLSSEDFASVISPIALLSDESIDVYAFDQAVGYRAVERDSWLKCSGSGLLDMLNPTYLRKSPAYASLRKQFDDLLRPIHDPLGNIVGRIGLDITASDLSEIWITKRSSFADGLLSHGNFYPTIGVLNGSPTAAARDQTDIEISVSEFRRWFTEQVTLLHGLALDPAIKIHVQSLAIRIGATSDDLPIAVGKSGFHSIDELKRIFAGLSAFEVVESEAFPVQVGSLSCHVFHDEHSQSLGILDGNMLAVPEGIGSWRSGMPIREQEPYEPEAFWRRLFATPLGEVLRIAADVWGCKMTDLLDGAYYKFLDINGDDTRAEVDTLQSKQMKVDVLHIDRPASV